MTRIRRRAGVLAGLFLFLACIPARAADQVPVPHGYIETMQWYARAAEAGDPQAQYLYGEILQRGLRGKADRKAAADWFEKAAKQGHGLAAYALGRAYESGMGRPRDLAKAAEWYSVAAKKGVPAALHNLARLTETGNGVKQNLAQAAIYYRAAAEGGVAAAAYNLGLLYQQGRGVPKDLLQAWAWFSRAAQNHYAAAIGPRDAIHKELNEADRAKALGILHEIEGKSVPAGTGPASDAGRSSKPATKPKS